MAVRDKSMSVWTDQRVVTRQEGRWERDSKVESLGSRVKEFFPFYPLALSSPEPPCQGSPLWLYLELALPFLPHLVCS